MARAHPQRGEIFRARIEDPATDRLRLGHEMWGGQAGERFCILISHDDYNKWRDRVTVALFTEHTSDKELALSLGGVTIQCSEGDPNQGDYSRADIDIDPRNATYYPIWRQLRTKVPVRDPHGNIIVEVPYKSIIDLTQLMTIYSFDTTDSELDPELCDVNWDLRNGNLKPHAMAWVDDALRQLISGSVQHNPHSPYREGHVIEINYPEVLIPGTPPQPVRKRCLVISTLGRFPSVCTIVPLERAVENAEVDPGIALVEVNPIGHYPAPDREIAICQEISAYDWQERIAVGPVGEVHDMDRVREALWDYLGLV